MNKSTEKPIESCPSCGYVFDDEQREAYLTDPKVKYCTGCGYLLKPHQE